ncbi:hypothetical protein TNCV_4112101 [Trichonephila clavipes]|nr:hypothetical protein TNCV_4112101 [Trichonephila clavipes]
MIPELSSPSPDFHTAPRGEHLSLYKLNVHWPPLHGGSLKSFTSSILPTVIPLGKWEGAAHVSSSTLEPP